MSILELEKVNFYVGSIKASGYSAGETTANGSMINYLSGEEMATMIGLNNSTTMQKTTIKRATKHARAGFYHCARKV